MITQLEIIYKLNLGVYKKATFITTHSTSSSNSFINVIEMNVKEDKIKTTFVGDEVHGLGSKIRRKALISKYDYRIGLSATPSRWFDDEGSSIIMDYFGNKMFEFSIEDAIRQLHIIIFQLKFSLQTTRRQSTSNLRKEFLNLGEMMTT